MNHNGVTAEQFGDTHRHRNGHGHALLTFPLPHLGNKHGQRPFVLTTFVFFTLFPVTLLWRIISSGWRWPLRFGD